MIDSIISAEIPSSEDDPHLRELVLRFNQHPHTHLNTTYSRCNKDGKCIWGFPQPIREKTELNQYGRVHYRRRKEEDQWTATYMPYLTKLLECHVNVDVCFTVNIFMYLYKYLFKGPDRTMFSIGTLDNENVDEISDYINARYLSASEAAW